MAHENGINGDTDSESVELNPLRRTRFHVNRVDSLEGRASLLGEQETKKSLRHMTREALPRLDNYRNIMSIQAAHRPSLDELHNPTLLNKVSNDFSEGSIVCESNTSSDMFEKTQITLARCEEFISNFFRVKSIVKF